ncbi:ephrin-B3b isoform X2 [Acipenser ruthenus]|uniref:ephrin-B3b isoform X2 n=1 Tax=Acipenser ruthenus TaxID=7906 RepID=UPI00274291EB|nr:ephrin-B3b isoform X2 [Acipenser ruthenus]
MGCRNTVSGFGFILLFTMDICGTSASNLEPIYWNSLNRRFAEEAGYVLYPQIGDRLDLICPASEPLGPRSTEDYEYYKLYLVNTGEQAARCEITGPPNLLLTCDKPSSDTRFTIKFQEYSPNLWGHEFKTHQDYYIIDPNGMGPDPQKPNPDLLPGQPPAPDPNRVPGKDKASDPSGNSTKQGGGENGPFPPSNIPIIAGAAGGSAFLLIIAIIIAVVCYRRRQSKHSDSHHPPLSLSTLTSPKRGGNNNGSEPSDIIIPLRTSDSAFCPHYEKVSGDYGHPVYIVQEMPPQSPANIYYKV